MPAAESVFVWPGPETAKVTTDRYAVAAKVGTGLHALSAFSSGEIEVIGAPAVHLALLNQKTSALMVEAKTAAFV